MDGQASATAEALTAALVATIAIVPLSLCAVAAAATLRGRRAGGVRPARATRRAAVVVLTVATGWVCYLTLPYAPAWGPVLLAFAACFVALAVVDRRGPRAAP